MTELVTDCPRCKSKKVTFDVTASNLRRIDYDWLHVYEIFGVCRHCKLSSIFAISQTEIVFNQIIGGKGKKLSDFNGSLNGYFEVNGYISLKDNASIPPPEHLPENIKSVFEEGATCLAVGCFNAAGTMFRLCVDMATSSLLPEEETEGLNHRTRRDLGLRLPWLFDNGLLPKELKDLSDCIKDDGNDGAHAGTLRQPEAEDLLDFTDALLTRLYSEPARIVLAKVRREERRA